jgi:hypothetical protein
VVEIPNCVIYIYLLRPRVHGCVRANGDPRTVGNFNHFRTLRTRTEMDLETSVLSYFNHLTRLVAQEDFIIKEGNLYELDEFLTCDSHS